MSAKKKRSVEDASAKTVKKAHRAKSTTSEEQDFARKCAEKFEADLGVEHPSFVRVMLPSHVSGGYWLGIPKSFRVEHLTSEKITMELIDENDTIYGSILIGKKNGLSGGWMGFAKDHELDIGDALVFELTEKSRFKVYIFKARASQDSKNSDKNDLESKKSDIINDGLDSTRHAKLIKVSASDDTTVRKQENNSATVIPNKIQRTSSQIAPADAPKVQPVAKPKARKSSSSAIKSSQIAQGDALKVQPAMPEARKCSSSKIASSKKPQGEAPKLQPVMKTNARKSSSSKTKKPSTVKMLTRKVFFETRFPGIRRS